MNKVLKKEWIITYNILKEKNVDVNVGRYMSPEK